MVLPHEPNSSLLERGINLLWHDAILPTRKDAAPNLRRFSEPCESVDGTMETMPSYRILFLISSFRGINTGSGGHYRSLRSLVEQLTMSWPDAKIRVLVYGDLPTDIYDNLPAEVESIDTTGQRFLSYSRQVLEAGRRFAPTHVHSFEKNAHLHGRWIARREGAKCYLTYPGGPNPRNYFPYAPDVVCFSAENRDYFSGLRKLKSARLHLIPQRVLATRPDNARIAALRAEVGDRDILLRIARIGQLHRTSILQTLALARELRGAGHNVSAVIVGVLEHPEVLAEVEEAAHEDDLVTTRPLYTSNAAELIPVAQAVVGAGRGIVEAALHGKTVFSPLQDSPLPVLITPSNWKHLQKYNFSGRSVLPADLIPDLSQAARAFAAGTSDGSNVLAGELGIERAVPRYQELYEANQSRRPHPFDFALHAAWVLAFYLPLSRRRGGSHA